MRFFFSYIARVPRKLFFIFSLSLLHSPSPFPAGPRTVGLVSQRSPIGLARTLLALRSWTNSDCLRPAPLRHAPLFEMKLRWCGSLQRCSAACGTATTTCASSPCTAQVCGIGALAWRCGLQYPRPRSTLRAQGSPAGPQCLLCAQTYDVWAPSASNERAAVGHRCKELTCKRGAFAHCAATSPTRHLASIDRSGAKLRNTRSKPTLRRASILRAGRPLCPIGAARSTSMGRFSCIGSPCFVKMGSCLPFVCSTFPGSRWDRSP